jgi:hypothetical protein
MLHVCQPIKLLAPFRTVTFFFCWLLQVIFVRCTSKLEYASIMWNSVRPTDANKLERIQRTFALSYNSFSFLQAHYRQLCYCSTILETAYLTPEAASPSCITFCLFIFCHPILDTISLRVHTRILDYPMFYVGSSRKHCPSHRLAPAANICWNVYTLRNTNFTLNHICYLPYRTVLYCTVLYVYIKILLSEV